MQARGKARNPSVYPEPRAYYTTPSRAAVDPGARLTAYQFNGVKMTIVRPVEPRSAKEFAAAPLATRMYWGTEPTRELHPLVASVYGFEPRPTTSICIPRAATVRFQDPFILANVSQPASAQAEPAILGAAQDILTLFKSLLAAVNSTPEETATFIYEKLAPWLKVSTLNPIIMQMWRSTNAAETKARH